MTTGSTVVSSGVGAWDLRGGGGAGMRDGGEGIRDTAGGGGVGGFESPGGGAGTRDAALGGGGGWDGTFTPAGGGVGLIAGCGWGFRDGGAGGREPVDTGPFCGAPCGRGGSEAGFEVVARGGGELALPLPVAEALGFLEGGAGGDFELAPMPVCYQGIRNLLFRTKQAKLGCDGSVS